MGKQLIQSISKCHFVLRRSNEGVVTIEDYSSNGTYINGERVGKGKKKIIEHNSYIALVSY